MAERKERMGRVKTQAWNDPERLALRDEALAHVRDPAHEDRLRLAQEAREFANEQARQLREGELSDGLKRSFLTPELQARYGQQYPDAQIITRPDGSSVLSWVERPVDPEELIRQRRLEAARANLPQVRHPGPVDPYTRDWR